MTETTEQSDNLTDRDKQRVGRGRYNVDDRQDLVIALRCSQGQKDRWQKAARAEDMALTSWIKREIDRISMQNADSE